MKSLKIYSILICLLCAGIFKSQIGIGTVNPDFSSILDVSSNNKGLLYPRMTTIEQLAIPSPAEGLQAFDTDFKCMMLLRIPNGPAFSEREP